MEAYVIRRFGGPEVFEKGNIAQPQVYPGQVLIKVCATSVNPVDCKIRQGKLAAIAPDFPAVLHGDVSGIVESTATDVTHLKPGDEVYACAGGVKGMGGALAEFILADASLVAKKPRTLNHREAAALPLVGITAWSALMDKAGVKNGDNVLVYGGTGGVGHVGVQLAKAAGANVVATCSSDSKAAMLRDLGIEQYFNYRQMDIETCVDKFTGGKGFDVVFDTVGGENIQHAFKAAALNGKVVSVSTRSSQDLSLMHAKGLTLYVVFMLIPLLHNVGREHHGEILKNIAAMVDDRKIMPLLDRSQFKLADVAQAHARLESGEATGKIVLEADSQ